MAVPMEGFIMGLREDIVLFLVLLIMKLMCFAAYDVDSHDIHA
jgi:hypothetical protein